MTNHIKQLKEYFIYDKKHHELRSKIENDLTEKFAEENLSDYARAAKRLIYMLDNEKPVVFENERIAFIRTLSNVPELFTDNEVEEIKKQHKLHEMGDVCNISVDYTKLLNSGFEAKKTELKAYLDKFKSDEIKSEYIEYQIKILEAAENLAERYRIQAIKQNNLTVAEVLSNVPKNPPKNFLEALQMFRIIHFMMWCGRNYHNTIGRFDQFMFPYLKADMDKGIYDYDSALELIEEFFLTFNRDSDLYPGMQQGDNGQSMVLGGLNPDGTDSYNLLSELSLKASLELKLIDPKINLRVHKDTPLEIYTLGSELTKQGLGFPQYSNDDIVIPGLMSLGYKKEDAHNYVVAACWEFIIPGKGMDIPNIDALSFADAVQNATMVNLPKAENFESFYSKVRENISEQVDIICNSTKNVYIFPAPFISLMMECEPGTDVSLGCVYNNYGIHGTGIATATDSLAAIKELVFEKKSISGENLLEALKNDFEGYDVLCNELRYQSPKMGNDIDSVDEIAVRLIDDFSEALKDKKNDRGGIFRAGTGSAMYYVWHGRDMGATADGRRKGEGLGANYSPSLFSKCKGPVSIIKSFAKPNFKKAINGGPLTIELHDSIFRNDSVLVKVAMLVKSFIDLGGHQLQLNAVNSDTLLDAQAHPENYKNLIVRVWGWSGYFVELDKEYQDHIIQRMELTV